MDRFTPAGCSEDPAAGAGVPHRQDNRHAGAAGKKKSEPPELSTNTGLGEEKQSGYPQSRPAPGDPQPRPRQDPNGQVWNLNPDGTLQNSRLPVEDVLKLSDQPFTPDQPDTPDKPPEP